MKDLSKPRPAQVLTGTMTDAELAARMQAAQAIARWLMAATTPPDRPVTHLLDA